MSSLPQRPEQVPADVDAGLLRAILADGRPAPRLGAADEAVLCVHGLGHDAWDFGPLQQLRPNNVSVVTLDLPGFGPARIDDTAPTPVVLADLARAIVDAAKSLARPPVVVASSLGGHAALIAALEQPQAFAGLVLLAPGGLVEVPGPMQAVLRAYYSATAIVDRPVDEVVRNTRRIFTNDSAINDQLAARKLALRRSSSSIRERFAVPFAAVCDDVFKRPVLDQVHRLKGLPTHAIFGDGDVVVPLSSGRALVERCGAQLTVIERCGHCPHLEAPARTSEIVFAFAQRVFAGAQAEAGA